MRAASALVFVLVLGGCSHASWHHFNPDAFFGGDPDEDPTPIQALVLSDPRCRELALDRSSDVADQGFDESVRDEVIARTYADCLAWAARGTTVTAK
jgi:hypothetical protein